MIRTPVWAVHRKWRRSTCRGLDRPKFSVVLLIQVSLECSAASASAEDPRCPYFVSKIGAKRRLRNRPEPLTIALRWLG